MQRSQRGYGALFSALHIQGLFNLAIMRLALDKDDSFNFIKTMCEGNSVLQRLDNYVFYFLEIEKRAEYSLNILILSTASALLMDHYLSDVICELFIGLEFCLIKSSTFSSRILITV